MSPRSAPPAVRAAVAAAVEDALLAGDSPEQCAARVLDGLLGAGWRIVPDLPTADLPGDRLAERRAVLAAASTPRYRNPPASAAA